MSADDIRVPSFDWLQQWDMHNVGVDAKREYAREELERLHSRNAPLLFAALSTGLPEQCDVLVSLIHEIGYTPMLRLYPKASPPPFDSQGRSLPESKRGKVLVTKVGVVGQMAQSEIKLRNAETTRYTGPARATLAYSSRGLYRTVEISETPRAFSLDDALVILRQWGVGLSSKRFHKKGRLDKWLVIEDSPWWYKTAEEMDAEHAQRDLEEMQQRSSRRKK